MTKQSMFARILSINFVSMLVCVIVMGTTQMLLMTNYLSKQSEDYLSKNAETIVSMIKGYVPIESLNNAVNSFASATGSYIFVIDSRGRVITSSDKSSFIGSAPLYLDKEYTRTVLSGQKSSTIGTMGGLFSEKMFTLQIPILDKEKSVLGAVSVSRPIPEHERMRHEMFKILMFSMFAIMSMSVALSYILAKSFTAPIKGISNTTKEFAKGNFKARANSGRSGIQELSELADAFNNMAQDLERAEETKNAFISDVSHELRTPMTTIGGFVTGILDDTIPQEKQKEYLEIVSGEIARLSRLVNTFLDITRMQSDKLTLNKSNFDINELIRIAIIGQEKKIEERGIDVRLEFESESCYAYADRDSITRVITNLLDNAIKFTDKGGSIRVSVTTKAHEVIVSVRNTGSGIPEEQRAMIFNRFYKADMSRSRNKSGTGIGLYLVKNILRAHGKDIIVESEEGKYADFIFRLDRGSRRTRQSQHND